MNVKPAPRENPDHFTIHIGTNDVTVTNKGKSPKAIADSITKLKITLKNSSHDVTISNIITRKDRGNPKVDEVNKHLAKLCEKISIY